MAEKSEKTTTRAERDKVLDQLLKDLEDLKQCGDGEWRARCPCHRIAIGVLHITQHPDGKLSLQCGHPKSKCKPEKIADKMRVPRDCLALPETGPAATEPPAAPSWWERPCEGETWTDPHRLARLFVRATATADGAPTLVQWRDEFHAWRSSAYRALGSGDLDAQLAKHAREVFVADLPHRQSEARAAGSKAVPKLPPVTGRVRADVRTNLAGLTNIPDDGRDAPFWLRGTRDIDPRAVVVAPNGLFTLDRIALGHGPFAPPTPDLFTPNALPFDAPLGECDPPKVWCEKVKEWFGNDTKAVQGLQEWLGYLLSADTAQHKILMLVGPPRSGKGTILRVLEKLAGSANVAATSFAQLSDTFGMQPLIGKRVAVIHDARLSGRTDTAAVAERMLSVSGDDRQPVNRKNLPMVTTRLDVRFVVATNEIPKLTDASGALASRFHILALPNSFLGREDKQLDKKLDAELPAILQWAAKGYVRLRTQGAFTQNEAAAQHHRQLEELSSPVRAFVRERCKIGPEFRETVGELFKSWKNWCEERGLDSGAENVFSRDLRSAFGHIEDTFPRSGEGKRIKYLKGIGLRPFYEWEEPAGTSAA